MTCMSRVLLAHWRLLLYTRYTTVYSAGRGDVAAKSPRICLHNDTAIAKCRKALQALGAIWAHDSLQWTKLTNTL